MLDFIKTNSFIIAQVFGFMAMTVAISMYQFNKHKKVMLLMVGCALLWCCHYTFLGLFTPVAMNFLGAVKNFIFSFKAFSRRLVKLINNPEKLFTYSTGYALEISGGR